MNTGLLPFTAFAGHRVHLGVCGSVAAYKAVDLMRGLQTLGIGVSVTLTEAATRFITPLTFQSLGAEAVYTSMFAPDSTDAFAHLAPGAVADVFVIAPATATTLARLAHGLADDMLAAQALAFKGPLLLAPAMNPRMWANPATRHNVVVLQERGAIILGPDRGAVACGDTGEGKLVGVECIQHETLRALGTTLPGVDMRGKRLLITLGPTREQWDGVRYWSNLSTGYMGACLATAAWYRGAEVYVLAGPGCPSLPAGIHRTDITSAGEMFATAKRLWPAMDAGIFAAAVADFSPVPLGGQKFKKSQATAGLDIHFTPNPDILASLAESKLPDQKILGFAAETADLETQVRSKLARKKADIVAGNLVGIPGSGFASPTNIMFVADATGKEEAWPLLPKTEVAWRLLDWLFSL